ncbi:glycosyl transferase family 2 [Desulfofarcimen acetoxidans DSM 771]|uniref:Glycosyl transferase family 2 n=1 Tax=Desulfofarcimen acetoxidans (strain ATCC 49208 / DSM 771 / KCTC 5769 / VKM B-1644 / 5575) TaxID=485916 RepID=C8VYT2_DESAS|nr:glycosyltransferase [Desulfofarcimen acetoxidans]ACV64803.1 glycosyl transferase family 2 [Desulfofarcimen acetoxidans DSM 771]
MSQEGKDTKNKKLIVVLGMHRSGTSAVTRGLQVLGVELGNRLMPPLEGNNDKGFFEDMDLYALNVEMLQSLGIDWHYLAPVEASDVDVLRKKGYFLRATELLRQKVCDVPVFGFKDPRVAKLLPFWKEVFIHCQFELGYILAVRHPLSVFKSLEKRDGFTSEKSYMLWLEHILTSLSGIEGYRCVPVDYDRLMHVPERELQRIAIGLELKIDADELLRYKTEFLDEGLRHTVYDLKDLLLDDTIPPIAYEIYTALNDVCAGKRRIDDIELKNQISLWSSEFYRIKSFLRLADKFSEQIVTLNQTVNERDFQINELSQAIADRDILLANLNQVVSERDGQILKLNQDIAGRDEQITVYNQVISEQDNQIYSLNQLITERNGQIGTLNQVLAERDVKISTLNQVVAKQDVQIISLTQSVGERDEQIVGLNQAMAECEEQFAEVFSSRSWRVTKPMRFLGRVMRGERENVLAGLRSYIHFDGRTNQKNNQASRSRIARKLVSHYYSSVLSRRCFAAIKAVSEKLVQPWFPVLHNNLFVDFKQYLQKQWLGGSGDVSNDASTELYSFPKIVKNEKYYPKVSVIVPNYNHARYLRQRLESIYRQTYQNYEVILLDDASSDESIQILKEFQFNYPSKTRCCFNSDNSGGVFYQWKRGFNLATGELIWIAESDDYCSENLLEELVRYFKNEAVMLAYCRTVFVDGDSSQQIWSLEEYLSELNSALWLKPFIKSAHQLVNTSWGIKNIVPNVSSAIFRNPGKLELLEDDGWKQMRICGDWVFYLHVIRGGLVAYSPNTTNYYRIHNKNTSVGTYKQDIYYREHEMVAKELIKLYRLEERVLEKQQRVLEAHWCSCRENFDEGSFRKCYDRKRISLLAKNRKANLLMITYALATGGGETFPIRLANLLKSVGYSVTLLNCHQEPTEIGVRNMLRGDIPLLELDYLHKLNAVVGDMGIEIVHSHHGWVDGTICALLEDNPNCKIIVTSHGMYEMMPPVDLDRIIPLLDKKVDKIVYIADKNLEPFESSVIDKNRFVKIGNALEKLEYEPVSREELGISKDAFVLCLVSRAIPDKGWQEGIEAIKLARQLSGKEIHLLLVGDGPEYERLKGNVRYSYVHLLGFRSNVRDFFAASDLGFLPSKFRGESFPLVIIECLQSNRPMLASDLGEVSKMLESESGLAGSVFPLNNWRIPVGCVAEIISEYAKNRDLYLEHLKRVPDTAKKFDPKALLHSYEEVYREVLSNQMYKVN